MDELQKALAALLDELGPHLRRIPKATGWKWVRQGDIFQAVEVDITEKDRIYCIVPGLWKLRNENSAAYSAVTQALTHDSVFTRAERKAGYYGQPRSIIEHVALAALVNPLDPTLDLERAWSSLVSLREVLDAKEIQANMRARIIGLELNTSPIQIQEGVELVRLSQEEIDLSLPVYDAFTPRRGNEFDHVHHTTELRATINLPVPENADAAFLAAGAEAQSECYRLAEEVLYALRLNWSGEIGYGGLQVSSPFSSVTSNLHATPFLIVGSMQLSRDAEQSLQKSLAHLKAARDDDVLNTSLRRFLIGRAPRAPYDRLVDYVIAWESILLTVDSDPQMLESSYRFSVNGATLLHACGTNENRHETRKLLSLIYGIRSSIVHGSDDARILKQLRKAGFPEINQLNNFLEQVYRAAFFWICDRPANKRPYRGEGWELLLWGNAQTNPAQPEQR